MNKQGELPRSGKRRYPGGRLFSMLLALCMIVTMLPATALAAAELATAVTVGGTVLNVGNRYATTNASGAVSLGGDEGTYNVKFDAATGTLTLRNANIKYESLTANAISATGSLTIEAVGTNAVSASDNSAAIYLTTGDLKLKGSGALTAVSAQTTAVGASNITVEGSITLTAVGGTMPTHTGGDGLYASNDIKIKDSARVTAIGGTCNKTFLAGSPGSTGIWAGVSLTLEGSATVTALGGDTTVSGYSAGISAGAITIADNAKMVAVGGKAGTNASYGLYAGGDITYTGGLLVAKGGKTTNPSNSLAMNKALTDSTDAAVTTAADAATNASRYCVVSPKTGGSPGPAPTADYHVVTGSVTSSTVDVDDHILWNSDNLHLTNTIVIAPDGNLGANTALSMPENAMLTLEGYNVLLAGDSTSDSIALEGGIASSNLIVAGSGDLTAISGSADYCYGIVNAAQLPSAGAITAIGGSGYYSYGIYGPISISSDTVIAIGGETGGSNNSYGIYQDDTLTLSGGSGAAIGKISAFKAAPTVTGPAAMGTYTDKLMAWGAVYVPPAAVSATPAAAVTEVTKALPIQASVAFALTTYPAGDYTVYADASTETVHATVTASLSGSILTLTHESDLPAGIYYVSVTETGKAESARLALTVSAYVPAPTTCRLTVNLNGGNGGTTDGDYASGAVISIDAGTKDGYSFSGWTATIGNNFADASSSSTTFTMPPNDTTITANWSYSGYTPPASAPGAPVIVDGKTENIGTEKKTGDTTTVTVDQSKLGENIGAATSGSSVIVQVSEAGSATASLMVQNIADMAAKGMTLTVQTGGVAYNLNTSAIDTAALAAAFPGADMSKVPFDVTIANSSVSVEGETLVLSPVAFTVTATYNGKTVEVDTFSAYIDRVIEVTAAQAANITTAVVVNADGSVRHVPTNVIEKDGKYYAVVSSRTNSTYALIQNEISFADAAGKWYEAAVNEMGSRKIIAGRSASAFDGDASITRAEFAVILVRALGLPADGISSFADVPADAWYNGAVATAAQYGIVSGKGDNQFAPNANITRQEAMLMLQRAAALTAFTGAAGNLDSFADAGSVSTWAIDAAKWNVGSGLFQGAGGKLNPLAEITRAESATVILRLLQKAGLVDVRSEA